MRLALPLLGLLAAAPVSADTLTLAETPVIEWKAVYGRVEAREAAPARARIGGLVDELTVSEGDLVTSGQKIALVRDEKIAFEIAALDAQIEVLQARLATAETELARGEALVDRGVSTQQQLDQLRTTVDVVRGEIAAANAQQAAVTQRESEGAVLAPASGRVLSVPTTVGAVVLPGELIAMIGGGGFFLRLAIPERHAAALEEGDEIQMHSDDAYGAGRIAKLYPQIENGRVIADVEVDGLDTAFVNARILVKLPIGERMALLVPRAAVHTRAGIDFVSVQAGDGHAERVVVLGEPISLDGAAMIEVLTGLVAGDAVVTP